MDALTYCYECNKDVASSPGDHAMWHALAKKASWADPTAHDWPREIASGKLNRLGDVWRVTELLDGQLVCSCTFDHDDPQGPTLSNWCEHIEKVIRGGEDAIDPVLGEPDIEYFVAPGTMWVPVRPTKKFFVNVAFAGVDHATGDAEVFIEPPVFEKDKLGNPVVNGAVTIPERSIGYLYKGEGRMVLRNMIIEWLRGHYKTAPQCKGATHHKVVFGRTDARLLESKELSQHLEDIYYLQFTGRCKTCRSALPTDFDKDVPDL